MGVQRRKMAVGGFSVLAGLLGFVSVAWACTYQPSLFTPSAQAGRRGTEVTVRGEGVVPRGPVEVRWNDVEGPRMATSTADERGGFSAAVTIPDVAPDVYYLVAVADNDVARTAFEVTTDSSSGSATLTPTQSRTAPAALWSAPSDAQTAPASSRPTAGLALGMTLLAVGSVALLAGFAIAVVRARRVAAPLD